MLFLKKQSKSKKADIMLFYFRVNKINSLEKKLKFLKIEMLTNS